MSYYRRKISKYNQTNYFIWSIFLILLATICILIWFGCLYVFNYPENPICYNILKKINKVKSPKEYRYNIPKGNVMDAEQLYNFFYEKDEKKLATVNSILKRNYINNFKLVELKTVFAEGEFRIKQIKKLSNEDVFQNGIAVRAQSMIFKEVYIEYIFPGHNISETHFEIGDIITISKKKDHAVVINVDINIEYEMCFSIVSLTYYDHPGRENKSFKVRSPKFLNLHGKWPITDNSIGRISK